MLMSHYEYEVVDAYALADDSTTVHQQGVLTYKLFATTPSCYMHTRNPNMNCTIMYNQDCTLRRVQCLIKGVESNN